MVVGDTVTAITIIEISTQSVPVIVCLLSINGGTRRGRGSIIGTGGIATPCGTHRVTPTCGRGCSQVIKVTFIIENSNVIEVKHVWVEI